MSDAKKLSISSLSDVSRSIRGWHATQQRAAKTRADERAAYRAQQQREREAQKRQEATMLQLVRDDFDRADTTQGRMDVMDSPEYKSLSATSKLKLLPDRLQTYGGFAKGAAGIAGSVLQDDAAKQRAAGQHLRARATDAARGILTTPTHLLGESLEQAGKGNVVNTAGNAAFALASATPVGAAFNAGIAQSEVEQKAQNFFENWDARGRPLYDFTQKDSPKIVQEASDAARLGWNILPFAVLHRGYRSAKEYPARSKAREAAAHAPVPEGTGMRAATYQAAARQHALNQYAQNAARVQAAAKTGDRGMRGIAREPRAFADEFAKQMTQRRFSTVYSDMVPWRAAKDVVFGERNLPIGAPVAAAGAIRSVPQINMRDDAMRGKITSQKALSTKPSVTDMSQQISFTQKPFLGKKIDSGGWYVFEKDGAHIGDASIGLKKEGDLIKPGGFTFPRGRTFTTPTALVDSFSISETLQGKGLGRQVWDEIEKIARENGMKRIELMSVMGSSTGFWEKMGFRPSREYPVWEKELGNDVRPSPHAGQQQMLFKTGGKRDMQSGDINEQAQLKVQQSTLTDRFGYSFTEESVPVARLVRAPAFQPRITESGRATEESVFTTGYEEGRVDQPVLVWEKDGRLIVLGGHSRTKGMERRAEAELPNPETIKARVYRTIDEAAAKQISRGANQGGQYEAHLDMAKSIWESQREHKEPAVQKQNMARGYAYDDYAQLWDIAERDPNLKAKIAEGALPSEDVLFYARESRQKGLPATEAVEIIGSLDRAGKLSRKLFQAVVRLKAGLKKAGIFKDSEQTLFDVGQLPEKQLEGTLTLLERYEKERAQLTRLTNAYKTVAESREGKLPKELEAEKTALEHKLGRIEEALLARLKQEKSEQPAKTASDIQDSSSIQNANKIQDVSRLLPAGSRGSVEWLLGSGNAPPLAGTPPQWKKHQNYRQWQREVTDWEGGERQKQAAFAARQEANRDPGMLETGQKEALLTQMNFTGDKWRTDPKSGQRIPKGRWQPKVNVPDVMELERSGTAVLDVLQVPEGGERAPVTFRLDGNKELSFRPFILPLLKQAAANGKQAYVDVNSGGASVVKVLPDLAAAGMQEAHLNFFDKEKHLVEQALYEGRLDDVVGKVRETDGRFRWQLLQRLSKDHVNDASPEVNTLVQKYLEAYPDGSFDDHFIEWIEKTKLDGEHIPIPLQGSEYYEAWRQVILNAFGEITPKEIKTLDDAISQAYRDRIATRGNQGFIGLSGMKSKEQSVENFIAALRQDAAAYAKAREAGLKVSVYSEDGKRFVRGRMVDLKRRGLIDKTVLYTDPPYVQTTKTYLPQVRDHAGRVALAEYTTPDGLEKVYKPALQEIKNGLDFIATNDVHAGYIERFLTYPFNHRIYAYKEHTTPTSLIHTLGTPQELRQHRAKERFKRVRGYVPAQRIDPQLNPGGSGFGPDEPAWGDFLDNVKQNRQLPDEVRRAFVEERLRDIPKPKFGATISTLDPLRAAEIQDNQRFGVMKDRVRSLEEAHHEQHVEEMAFDTEHQQIQAETGVKQGNARSLLAFRIAEGDAEAIARAHDTPGAHKYAAWARKKYDEWLDRMNAERVGVGKDPIVKRQKYMTHYQELHEIGEILHAFGIDMNRVPAQMLSISEFTKPNSRFFQYAKRREGVRHTPDAVGAILSYKSKAFEQIHMTRPIKLFRDILEYRVRAPTAYEGHRTVSATYFGTKYPHAYEYWTDYLNSLTGKRDKIDKLIPEIAARAGVVRRLFARGAIGGNLHTVAIQPAAVANAIRETGVFALPGYGAMAHPTGRWATYALKHSRVLLTRRFEVDAKLEKLFGSMKAAQAYDALGRTITKPIQAMDVVTATGAWLSGFFHARHGLGLSAHEAHRYADDVVVRTQSSGNAIHRPPINRGEIKTTFGQFQTWVYNEYRSITQDTFGAAIFGGHRWRASMADETGIRGLRDGRRKGLSRMLWLVLGGYLVNEVFNQILGEDVTLSPVHIGQALLAGNRERAVGNATTMLPYASTVRFGGSPTTQFFGSIPYAAIGDDDQRRDALRTLKSVGARLLPAGGQISKTTRAVPAVATGEMEIGRETLPIDGTAENIRALLMGKYGTKAAQGYFESREMGIPYDLYLEVKRLEVAGEHASAKELVETYTGGTAYRKERRDTTSELRETIEKAQRAGNSAALQEALTAYMAVDPEAALQYMKRLQRPQIDFGLPRAPDEAALGRLSMRERVDYYLHAGDKVGFDTYMGSLPPRQQAEVRAYLIRKAALSGRQPVGQ